MRNVIRYIFLQHPPRACQYFSGTPSLLVKILRYPPSPTPPPPPPMAYSNTKSFKFLLLFVTCLNILCVSSVYLKVRILLLFGTWLVEQPITVCTSVVQNGPSTSCTSRYKICSISFINISFIINFIQDNVGTTIAGTIIFRTGLIFTVSQVFSIWVWLTKVISYAIKFVFFCYVPVSHLVIIHVLQRCQFWGTGWLEIESEQASAEGASLPRGVWGHAPRGNFLNLSSPRSLFLHSEVI